MIGSRRIDGCASLFSEYVVNEFSLLTLMFLGAVGFAAVFFIAFVIAIVLTGRQHSRSWQQRSREAKPSGTSLDQASLSNQTDDASYAPAGAYQREEFPYTRRDELLTPAERAFFAVLGTTIPPDWHVFPQVRLASLVQIRKGTRNWKPHYSRVAQKCVDFVICDATAVAPRLVIELDDSSHNRPDRQKRDAFVDAVLKAAGLPIVHVRWQRQYDPSQLAAQIRAAIGLPTPSNDASGARVHVPIADQPASRPVAEIHQANPEHPSRWACRRCGTHVGATATYCPGCGMRLEL